MTGLIRCSVAAAVGGLLGAAIWAAITYFTGYEIGWIAWGVGAIVGFSVRLAAAEQTGAVFGMVAVTAAIVALLAGKYAAVHLLISKEMFDPAQMTVSAEDLQILIADEVVEEWDADGRQLRWPEGMSVDDAMSAADYPPDVWAEAESRWADLGPAEQQNRVEERRELLLQFAGVFRDQLTQEGFRESFSPIDLLFFGLAVMTAFRLGTGSSDDSPAVAS